MADPLSIPDASIMIVRYFQTRKQNSQLDCIEQMHGLLGIKDISNRYYILVLYSLNSVCAANHDAG